jgi:hypothetical protein
MVRVHLLHARNMRVMCAGSYGDVTNVVVQVVQTYDPLIMRHVDIHVFALVLNSGTGASRTDLGRGW